MKRFIKGLLLAVGVLVGSSVWAQVYCPDGGIPNPTGQFAGLCSDGSVPQAGGGGGSGGNGGYVPPTVIHLPSSYGAVAVSKSLNKVGYSSKQASERASKQIALAECGVSDCKILTTYSNACAAMSWGNKQQKGGFFLVRGSSVSMEAAENDALLACSSLGGSACQIIFSDCSLAGQIDGR